MAEQQSTANRVLTVLTFVLRKLLWACAVIFIVTTLVFVIQRSIPGDPADNILGENATARDKQLFRQRLHLDRPLPQQYWLYLGEIFDGSFGHSFVYTAEKVAVSRLILHNMLPTLELALGGILVAIGLALPLGLVSAVRQHGIVDHTAMLFAFVGVAVPNFWLGPILIYVLCIQLKWLPDPVAEAAGLLGLVLPSFVLGSALAAKLTRMVRTSVLDVLNEAHVTAARARGLREAAVVGKHVLRNALIPVVTVVGLQFADLLTGALITEKIFSRPGMGTLLLDSISQRDYPVVQGCVILIAVVYVVLNMLTDIVYAAIDPRIRVAGGARA